MWGAHFWNLGLTTEMDLKHIGLVTVSSTDNYPHEQGKKGIKTPLEGSQNFRVLWWWRHWGLKGLKIGKEKPALGGLKLWVKGLFAFQDNLKDKGQGCIDHAQAVQWLEA